MSITINLFAMAGIVILSLMGGFGIGRSVSRMMADTERRIREDETEEELRAENREKFISEGKRRTQHRNGKFMTETKRISRGQSVGSPVAGTVRPFFEGSRKGVWIQPEQGRLYAPVAGKITRLYPMGNAMLLRSEFGMELLLQVGEMGDELHSVYYRSHVVQNEIVTKGKLLLEFDVEGLQAEGVSPVVSVTVQTDDDTRDITVTAKESIKNGEELLWVR